MRGAQSVALSSVRIVCESSEKCYQCGIIRNYSEPCEYAPSPFVFWKWVFMPERLSSNSIPDRRLHLTRQPLSSRPSPSGPSKYHDPDGVLIWKQRYSSSRVLPDGNIDTVYWPEKTLVGDVSQIQSAQMHCKVSQASTEAITGGWTNQVWSSTTLFAYMFAQTSGEIQASVTGTFGQNVGIQSIHKPCSGIQSSESRL